MVRIGDLKIGRKYDFEAIALEDGSHEGYVEEGIREWSGWLLGITPNSDEYTWTLFLKDDEGCDLYIRIADYNGIFQRPEPQRRGDELTNMLSWVCNLDDDSSEEEEEEEDEEEEENNEGGNGGNMNGNWGGGGRHLRRRQRKTRKQKRKSRNSKKTRRAH